MCSAEPLLLPAPRSSFSHSSHDRTWDFSQTISMIPLAKKTEVPGMRRVISSSDLLFVLQCQSAAPERLRETSSSHTQGSEAPSVDELISRDLTRPSTSVLSVYLTWFFFSPGLFGWKGKNNNVSERLVPDRLRLLVLLYSPKTRHTLDQVTWITS